MKKIKVWHLANCSTCQRILQELSLNDENAELINIKEKNISKEELESIQKSLNCSYEELFSKRAMKFKTLKDSLKSDEDFKQGILGEYTFLKRPVIQINDNFFVGNSKKIVQLAKEELLN